MAKMTRYEHGVPSWVEMGTKDLASSLGFYTQLFGWQGQDMGAETGHYTIFSKNGKQVAAFSPEPLPGASCRPPTSPVRRPSIPRRSAGAGAEPTSMPRPRSAGARSPESCLAPPDLPAPVPDHWLVYFGAADVDADAERATGRGATLVAGPMDIPGTGRFAVLVDPEGAAFALFKS